MDDQKTCFIIMPIANQDGYAPGHFDRVYEYLIKPAVEQAGLTPCRADDCLETNFIILNILKQIISSDMALCDLSSLNPNVLYELGVRQAFDLPVTLIKDTRTRRIFDIQGLRDMEYDESLRVDRVKAQVIELAEAIKSTSNKSNNSVNSLVQLLGITPANVKSTELSPETGILLNAIQALSERLSNIESDNFSFNSKPRVIAINPQNHLTSSDIQTGDYVMHQRWGAGEVINKEPGGIAVIDFNGKLKRLVTEASPIVKVHKIEPDSKTS